MDGMGKSLKEKFPLEALSSVEHSHLWCLQCIGCDSLPGKPTSLARVAAESIESRVGPLVFVVLNGLCSVGDSAPFVCTEFFRKGQAQAVEDAGPACL